MRKLKKIEMFDVFVYTFISLTCVTMVYPFLNVIAIAFSNYAEYLKHPLMIFPKGFTIGAFAYVFSNDLIHRAYLNTIIVTLLGVGLGMTLIVLTAYPLSKKKLKGKTLFMNIIIFTMMFHGGIIPNYYLMRSIGLLDTLWALILPGAMTAFNLILMRNFFEALPESLEEAAKIDGASDLFILFKIAIPLSKSIIATLSLFIAVAYWNSYFNAVLYIRNKNFWTLQLVLREIILSNSAQSISSGSDVASNQEYIMPVTIKYASLVAVILPILTVYPFLQKYFVKGIMVGAVKG